MKFITALFLAVVAPVFADSAAVKHPVYPPPLNVDKWTTREAYLERADRYLKMDETTLLAIIPEQNGFIFCGCPNCDGGVEELHLRWKGIDDPHHVYCPFCKMVYPNDKYPMTHTLEAADDRGVKRTWRYHKDTKGNEYHFAAKARYQAKHHFIYYAARDLGAAYQLTGDNKYARLVVLILHRFAEVYPGWNLMNDYPAPGKKFPVVGAFPKGKAGWTGRLTRWYYADIPTRMIKAYDQVYNSGELQNISKEKSVDVRKMIEDDFFRRAIVFLRDSYREEYSNMSPYIYSGLIVGGRVLGEPAYVHEGVARARGLFEKRFFFDGMWYEGSPSYHRMTIGLMDKVLADAKGYSDDKYDNLDMARDIPIIRRANTIGKLMALPNGKRVAVHDTWAQERPGSDAGGAGRSMILNDFGHARLAFGHGEKAFQAHLHFSSAFGHRHHDNLSMILYAHGQELLTDIGYSTTHLRAYTTQSASHNTVVVDGKDHKPADRPGNVELLSIHPDEPVQMIRVSQPTTYGGEVKVFARQLIAVRVDDDNAYVVDQFNVEGGKTHEYFLHGSADLPQSAELTVALAPVEKAGYDFFRNPRTGTATDRFSVTWRFTDDTPARLRSTILGQAGARVVLADTRQVRPAGYGSQADESKLDDHWRPSFMLVRSKDDNTSSFLAIHEPYVGKPFIDDLQLQRDGDAVTIVVKHRAGVDRITLHRGRRASVQRDDKFDWSIGREPAWTGKLVAASRDPKNDACHLEVDSDAPANARRVIVTHGDGSNHAYAVRRVDGRRIHIDGDIGFTINGDETRFVSYPQRRIAGPNTCRIEHVAYRPGPTPVYK